MLEMMGVDDSTKLIIFIMLSFSFFVGILVAVSREAYLFFNKALQKKYGIRRTFITFIEDTHYDIVDRFVLKYRVVAGLIISISAFLLLLIYKS